MVGHGFDLNGAQARGVGHRRATHAGKHHRAHYIHMSQAALEPADQGQGIAVDAVRDASGVHQVASKNEKWHGQQRKTVDAGHHAVYHHKRW